MCELLVGLGAGVRVVGVVRWLLWLEVAIETTADVAVCSACGTPARLKDRCRVSHVDLPAFGQPTRLVWNKRRWRCPAAFCRAGSWTERNDEIAPAAHVMSTRAGRWCTRQVGANGRAVSEVAGELRCDWHTVNDAVLAYGEALLRSDGDRVGDVYALSLDETMFVHRGPWRTASWSTQIVDARSGQLLDIVAGRDSTGPGEWLSKRDPEWRARIQWAVMDLSGPYRKTFNTWLPHAGQVADPFHVIRTANNRLDECRRRVQNETLGHRGRKDDPLYRARKLLSIAEERLRDAAGRLIDLLKAGDPKGDVAYAWHAKEAVRFFYTIPNIDAAKRYLAELASDLQHFDYPIEVRALGRTLERWHTQICNWHHCRATNGPAEAVNRLFRFHGVVSSGSRCQLGLPA